MNIMIDSKTKKQEHSLLQAVLAEIGDSEYTNTEDIQIALNYYNAELRGDEIEGRSSVQSHDVADMIEALTAQMMPSFSRTDLASFEAISEEDEAQAREESEYINKIVSDANNGFITIQEALKNSLLTRNCVIKVFVESKVKIKTIGITDDFTDEDFLSLQSGLSENQELYVDDSDDVIEGDWPVGIMTTDRKLRTESIPPEEFIYTKGWHKQYLEECPFTAHHREIRRYELLDMGFDADDVSELNQSTAEYLSIRDDEETTDTTSQNSMMDTIDFYECYYIYDMNGDGYPELIKACIGSGVLLSYEEVDFHPFAGGSTVLMPNRFRGVSVFDQQKDVQDGKTKTLRQYADNINHNNNRRLEVEIKNILEPNDLVDSKPGGIVKTRKIGSIAPIPVDDIGMSCIQFLSYWDKIRTNRSGASLDMVSENMQVGGETAHGAERIISSKEQIGALASDTFKETVVKSMYLLAHKTVRSFFDGNLKAKTNGKWIETNPALWGDRPSVTITIGASQGQSNKELSTISAIIEQQSRAFQNSQGGVLVNHMNVYNSLIDYARAAGSKDPSRYWLDPNSEESKSTLKSNQEQGQKEKELQDNLNTQMVKNETIRANADLQSKKSQSIVANIRMQLDSMKVELASAEQDADKQIDIIKHYDNLAMQLTSLESQYDKQVNDYSQNKKDVR